jgi:hypothetical protein
MLIARFTARDPKPTFKVPDPIASDGWTVENFAAGLRVRILGE